jgi:hypothetical protein
LAGFALRLYLNPAWESILAAQDSGYMIDHVEPKLSGYNFTGAWILRTTNLDLSEMQYRQS